MIDIIPGKPFFFAEEDNFALCIDRFYCASGNFILSGWLFNCILTDITYQDDFDSAGGETRYHVREDVASGFNYNNSSVRGFITVLPYFKSSLFIKISAIGLSEFIFNLKCSYVKNLSSDEAVLLVKDNMNHIGFIFKYLNKSELIVKEVAKHAPSFTASDICHGHIEMARGVQDIGGLIIGWKVGENDSNFALITDFGQCLDMSKISRWHRRDIVEAYGVSHGDQSHFSGFIASQIIDFSPNSEIYLLFENQELLYLIAQSKWERAPVDPISFARWCFSYTSPMNKFYQRLDSHDGVIIERLIKRQKKRSNTDSYHVKEYGKANIDPVCSIVIPLYRRYDFVYNQLLELSSDNYVKNKCEIIFVLDDPLIEESFQAIALVLNDSYDLPFKVVYSHYNRGFAGATNLGSNIARSQYTLLLNSDVIPVEDGWLETMISVIQSNPNTGIVGSRLLFANGAIQHDGMDFVWEESWNCHLNKHPKSGFDISDLKNQTITDQISVTAACMLLRSDEFREIGYLDDEFLIGDFEDSDLCLRYRENGFEIKCVHHNSLVHLERQSFSSLGSNDFRDKVARYNAWKHERRWGQVIKSFNI